MSKDKKIEIEKEEKITQIFSYKVTMMVHIVADDETTAKNQLDSQGGIMTQRDVELLNSTPLFGEKENK